MLAGCSLVVDYCLTKVFVGQWDSQPRSSHGRSRMADRIAFLEVAYHLDMCISEVQGYPLVSVLAYPYLLLVFEMQQRASGPLVSANTRFARFLDTLLALTVYRLTTVSRHSACEAVDQLGCITTRVGLDPIQNGRVGSKPRETSTFYTLLHLRFGDARRRDHPTLGMRFPTRTLSCRCRLPRYLDQFCHRFHHCTTDRLM